MSSEDESHASLAFNLLSIERTQLFEGPLEAEIALGPL
jgi:hypothetical protein